MQKFTDFSFTGGFPFDVNVLEFDRQGIYETILALYADAGTTPLIISGVSSISGTGWVLINGEVLPYVGPAIPILLGPGEDYYVVPSQSSSPAIFQDGSSHNVLNCTRIAGIQVASVSAPPSGGVLFNSLVPFAKIIGDKARSSGWTTWISIPSSSAVFSGEVKYRKNIMTNTLQLKGSIEVNSAAMSGTSSPPLLPMFWNIASGLPASCLPATTTMFTAYYRYHLSRMMDYNGDGLIETLTGELSASGNLTLGLKKNDGSVARYTVTFNTIIPLD